MSLTKDQKRLCRIEVIKYHIINHLEMDEDITWNLSEHQMELIINSIKSFFIEEEDNMLYILFGCEEDDSKN